VSLNEEGYAKGIYVIILSNLMRQHDIILVSSATCAKNITHQLKNGFEDYFKSKIKVQGQNELFLKFRD
jgi:response regulator of citrate/malate metabolism